MLVGKDVHRTTKLSVIVDNAHSSLRVWDNGFGTFIPNVVLRLFFFFGLIINGDGVGVRSWSPRELGSI